MSFLVFKKCCCCVDLRLGSFIIAYFTMAYRISSLIYSSIQLSNTNSMLFHNQHFLNEDLSFHKLIGIISIMLQVFEVLICFALIIGLYKRLDQHLEMFYVGSFAFMVMSMIMYVIILFRYSHSLKSLAWLILVVEISLKLIFFYFLMVIRSYYYKMKAETDDNEKLTRKNNANNYFANTKPILITTKP